MSEELSPLCQKLKCLVMDCHESRTNTTSFCWDHEREWASSQERRGIEDLTSDDQYNEHMMKFCERKWMETRVAELQLAMGIDPNEDDDEAEGDEE